MSSGLQLKNCVSGFGYLSEPDKCTDKQLLRDKANVMFCQTDLGWINQDMSEKMAKIKILSGMMLKRRSEERK